jgi:hypothetical protein
MSESDADNISRLELMGSGDPTWDLSKNDTAAIRFALDEIRSAKAVFLAASGSALSPVDPARAVQTMLDKLSSDDVFTFNWLLAVARSDAERKGAETRTALRSLSDFARSYGKYHAEKFYGPGTQVAAITELNRLCDLADAALGKLAAPEVHVPRAKDRDAWLGSDMTEEGDR